MQIKCKASQPAQKKKEKNIVTFTSCQSLFLKKLEAHLTSRVINHKHRVSLVQ